MAQVIDDIELERRGMPINIIGSLQTLAGVVQTFIFHQGQEASYESPPEFAERVERFREYYFNRLQWESYRTVLLCAEYLKKKQGKEIQTVPEPPLLQKVKFPIKMSHNAKMQNYVDQVKNKTAELSSAIFDLSDKELTSSVAQIVEDILTNLTDNFPAINLPKIGCLDTVNETEEAEVPPEYLLTYLICKYLVILHKSVCFRLKKMQAE